MERQWMKQVGMVRLDIRCFFAFNYVLRNALIQEAKAETDS